MSDSPEEQKQTEQPKQGALPLDWTRVQLAPAEEKLEGDEDDHHEQELPLRYPWDVAQLPSPDEEEWMVVGTAGQKITKLGMDLSEKVEAPGNIRELRLRSHMIRTMEGLAGFVNLRVLELYDNMIDELQCLTEGEGGAPAATTLRVLDMSFNSIRDMAPVSQCPHLTELYLANNKLKRISGLESLKSLIKIDLGANRIRVIEGLEHLENLEELWLGKNKIERIAGLEKLTQLRRLDVQSNRLTTLEGLTPSQVDTLEELYLSHNGITDEGASLGLSLPFTKLSIIDMSRNKLKSTTPFAHLGASLEDLWVSGNQMESLDDLAESLASLTKLDVIYLEYNPLQKGDPLYRKRLKELVPSLTQIDANVIRPNEFSSAVPALPARTMEEQMRQLQDRVVQKAKEQTKRVTENQQQQQKQDGDDNDNNDE